LTAASFCFKGLSIPVIASDAKQSSAETKRRRINHERIGGARVGDADPGASHKGWIASLRTE